MKNLKWRAILVGVVLIAGIIYLVPTFSPSLPPGWTTVLPKEKIHLGLDLQGGMHLVLEVEAAKAVENRVERLSEELKDRFREEHVPFIKVARAKGREIEVQLADLEQQNAVKQVLGKYFPALEATDSETIPEGARMTLTMVPTEAQHIEKLAVAQALETIRNRIDQFGVSEPDIRPEGEDRIMIQLPGVKDPQRAVALIGKTALLEFKLVAEDVTPQDVKEGKTPAGSKVFPMKHVDHTTGRSVDTQIVLQDRTLMTGEYITDARVSLDSQYNTPYVSLEFDPAGARVFERITDANVKRRLAIVLDGAVYSAPVIQEKISGILQSSFNFPVISKQICKTSAASDA